ncbi:MAG: arsenic resistance protein [Pseudomonadota bacterium]
MAKELNPSPAGAGDPTFKLQASATNPAPAAGWTAALIIGAILVGSVLGLLLPQTGALMSYSVDATLTVMIGLLFFELNLGSLARAFSNLKFLSVAWVANFLIVPVIGLAIASLVLPSHPLVFTGLMIYFLAPCTDWFLGFTRMARGDTGLGAALIPINLISQLLLFPVWIWMLMQHTGLVDFAAIPGILAQWFLVPLFLAQVLRAALKKGMSGQSFARLLDWTGQLVPIVIAALILQLFATHVGSLTENLEMVFLIAVAVFLFFTATFMLGEALSRLGKFAYEQRALLSMTMAARNAPLMLVITSAAIPDQPLILAAIVMGMLVEIPHLTMLKQLLLRQRRIAPQNASLAK